MITVLQFLQDSGSIMYFGSNDTTDDDIIILDPHWLMNVFKRIFNVLSDRNQV